ncbi:MAG TPA: luciferase family protein [Acidimicrobiales bacterium]
MPLPHRPGPRPSTTPTNPHTQLDQQPADQRQRDQLAAVLFALAGVEERPSLISVPGARALWLAEEVGGPPEAFMVGNEFAHLHPGPDQSLHAMLPPDLATEAIDAGWAEQHPVARRGLIAPNAVMIYAPRDDFERGVVEELVRAAHAFARGDHSRITLVPQGFLPISACSGPSNTCAPPHLCVGSVTVTPPRQRKTIEASESTEWKP